jgi:RTX calcium-binding nonapeptide repeat (4 copies)
MIKYKKNRAKKKEGNKEGNSNTPGNNPLDGNNPDRVLAARNGNDNLVGGDGNDTLISYSDAGEPSVLGQQVVNKNEPLANSNDTLTGGKGADQFLFALELDGKQQFLDKHTQADGRIDGEGLAGENDSSHNHWLESIGNDTISDFNLDQGDKIRIAGHTVDLFNIEQKGSDYILNLRSNQGNADQNNPNGAHDGDLVGTITLTGAADRYSQEQLQGAITVDNTPHYVADGRGVETVKEDTTPNRFGVVATAPPSTSPQPDPLLGDGSKTGMGTSNDITNTPKQTDGNIAPEVGTKTDPVSTLFAPKDNLAMDVNPPALGGFMNSHGKDMYFPGQNLDSICDNVRSIFGKGDMMSSVNNSHHS